MINNSSIGKWDRLNSKQLDSHFKMRLYKALTVLHLKPVPYWILCIKFTVIILIWLQALILARLSYRYGIENGPSRKLKNAEMVTVTLTLDAG